jgi:hypothetical protein
MLHVSPTCQGPPSHGCGFLRQFSRSASEPQPRRHRLSADGTGKFYLDFQLSESIGSPLLSPLQNPFPMSPPSGTLRVRQHMSLESLVPSPPLHPSVLRGKKLREGPGRFGSVCTCANISVHDSWPGTEAWGRLAVEGWIHHG